MDIVDLAFKPLRAVVGATEHEVERTLPVKDIEGIQAQILDGIGALSRATESIESHVEVVDTLASSLPELTAAVSALSTQLAALITILAPVAAAERDVMRAEEHVENAEQHVANVEHRLARFGGLFGGGRVESAEAEQDPPPAPGS